MSERSLGKMLREHIKRADRQTLNQALAAFEDTMTEIVRVACPLRRAEWCCVVICGFPLIPAVRKELSRPGRRETFFV
jgi:hypothetical protein